MRGGRGEAVEVLGESRDRGSRTAARARTPKRAPQTVAPAPVGRGRSRIMIMGSRHEQREQEKQNRHCIDTSEKALD